MSSSPQVLIVGAENGDAERIGRALGGSKAALTCRHADSQAAFLAGLEAGPDVIVAVYNPPRFGAMPALGLLRKHARDIPLIVVTRAAEECSATECMKGCASEYLREDELIRLAPAVARALERKRGRDAEGQADLTRGIQTGDLARAKEAVERLANHQRSLIAEVPLDELLERRQFAVELQEGLQQLLVAARLRLALAEREEDVRTREAAVGGVVSLLQEAMDTALSVTTELSLPFLSCGDLMSGLRWLAQWMARKYKQTVTVREEGPSHAPLGERATVLLFHAVRELLMNAVKHARVAEVRIDVAEQGNTLRIQVADAGPGFDPAILRMEGGSVEGFGLFGVRQRMESLGGRLLIESSPGRGSRFFLLLPRGRPPLAEGPVHASGMRGRYAAGSALATAPDRALRVLVVDDHAVVRQGLVRLLQAEAGIEIVGEAANGAQAVKLTGELLPDVVTMDIDMPGMNGIEATRRIRAEWPTIRVIGLSMYDDSALDLLMREAGAADYIPKGSPIDLLMAAIRNWKRE